MMDYLLKLIKIVKKIFMDKREIYQLFYASDFYFKEARGLFNKIDPNLLSISLVTWNKKIINDITKYKNNDFFYFSCHLDSCAIRLYSIEENLRRTSTRWNLYKSKIWINDNNIIQKEVAQNIIDYKKEILHIILRHAIAHDEDMIFKNYKKVHKLLKKFYLKQNHEFIFKTLSRIKDIIEGEIF